MLSCIYDFVSDFVFILLCFCSMSFDLCFGCVWIGLFIPDFVEVRRNMVEAGDNQCRTVSSSFKVAPWLYRLEILWASLLSGDHRW